MKWSREWHDNISNKRNEINIFSYSFETKDEMEQKITHNEIINVLGKLTNFRKRTWTASKIIANVNTPDDTT